MSHQISECPNCRRTFIGDGPRARPGLGRCRVCGTTLIGGRGEGEAEVRDRLYGRRAAVASAPRDDHSKEGDPR
jgi:hypothetical protein